MSCSRHCFASKYISVDYNDSAPLSAIDLYLYYKQYVKLVFADIEIWLNLTFEIQWVNLSSFIHVFAFIFFGDNYIDITFYSSNDNG